MSILHIEREIDDEENEKINATPPLFWFAVNIDTKSPSCGNGIPDLPQTHAETHAANEPASCFSVTPVATKKNMSPTLEHSKYPCVVDYDCDDGDADADADTDDDDDNDNERHYNNKERGAHR